MERNQRVVVQILSHLGQVWVYASHKSELLTTSMMVSVGNVPPLGTKQYPLPLIDSNFSHVNIEQQECCVNFYDFPGFVWTFLCIKWVFNAFMCIIQIWTTCTCYGADKLVEKSNLWSLGACLGPMQEMGMKFEHHGTVALRQTSTYLLL